MVLGAALEGQSVSFCTGLVTITSPSGTQLHTKAGVNAAHLQETSPERAAGQTGLPPLGKELPTTDTDATFLTREAR